MDSNQEQGDTQPALERSTFVSLKPTTSLTQESVYITQEGSDSKRPSLIKIAVVCYFTYIIATVPAMFLQFVAGILSWGGGNFAGYVVSLMGLIVLVSLPLLLQTLFFKNKVHRVMPKVFIEGAYVLLLIVSSYFLGSLLVGKLSNGRNSIPTDTLILYLIIILSVVASSIINATLQYRAALKPGNNSKNPGKALFVLGVISSIVTLLMILGVTYRYGITETITQNKYKQQQDAVKENEVATSNSAKAEFVKDVRDWFVYPDKLSSSGNQYQVSYHNYSPESTYNTSSNSTVPSPAQLRSGYDHPELSTTIIFVQWEYNADALYQWPTCISDETQCETIDTEKGNVACRRMYGRVDCQLLTIENQILWLQYDNLIDKLDVAQLFNDLVSIKSSNIVLTD